MKRGIVPLVLLHCVVFAKRLFGILDSLLVYLDCHRLNEFPGRFSEKRVTEI